MATLHALHGLPGSGKTTLAVRMATERPAVRFTPDEWMVALYGVNPSIEVFREQHPKIMALIWEHTTRVLGCDTDVILDVGFWSRGSRDEVRARAKSIGVPVTFYACSCAPGVARGRVLNRVVAADGRSLVINEAAFDLFLAQFEPMGPDEPHLVVPDVSATGT